MSEISELNGGLQLGVNVSICGLMVSIKKVFLCSILVGSLMAQVTMISPRSYYIEENWPSHTLRLSKVGTLKDIFDSGIRPFFRPGWDDGSKLEFKHARIHIQQPNGIMLPEFSVDYAELTPKPSGLSELVMTSHPMSVGDVRQRMLKWTKLLGKSEEELDQFLSLVEADYSGFDDPDLRSAAGAFSGFWVGEDKERYSLELLKAYCEEVPLRIRISIDWDGARQPQDRRIFFKDGIPSPEGYEGIKIEVSHQFGPDGIVEMMLAKGIPIRNGHRIASPENKFYSTRDNKFSIFSPQDTRDLDHGDQVRHPDYLNYWIFGGAVLVAIFAAFIFLFRRKKLTGQLSSGKLQ